MTAVNERPSVPQDPRKLRQAPAVLFMEPITLPPWPAAEDNDDADFRRRASDRIKGMSREHFDAAVAKALASSFVTDTERAFLESDTKQRWGLVLFLAAQLKRNRQAQIMAVWRKREKETAPEKQPDQNPSGELKIPRKPGRHGQQLASPTGRQRQKRRKKGLRPGGRH